MNNRLTIRRMTTDKRRYSVRLLHAGGPTLFEVRRLCTGFVDVDVSGALPDAAIRIAVLHCVGRASNGTSRASHGTPVINISLDEAVGFPAQGTMQSKTMTSRSRGSG